MLIRNTSILSLHDLSIRRNVDILIQGPRITRIGHGLSDKGEVLDGQGFYVIPGLANTHAHTAMTLFRGVAEDVKIEDWFNKHIWVLEKNLTPEDVYVGTLLGAAEMLLSGTTVVVDMYFHMDQAARAFREAGMRADISQGLFGFGDNWKDLYQAALRFSKEYRDYDPRITVSLAPHSPYLCPDELLRDSVAKAEDGGSSFTSMFPKRQARWPEVYRNVR
jgi:5-methylthioadenosine/S-adenosylhomocysteine deaminase